VFIREQGPFRQQALENVDGDDAASVNQAMIFVDALDSPWFQVYPDIGNLAEMRFTGPVLLEMWNDGSPKALQIVQRSREWVVQRMVAGGLLAEENETP
jgi:L-ribulose-5-phosphate 3-epimerase UlaE